MCLPFNVYIYIYIYVCYIAIVYYLTQFWNIYVIKKNFFSNLFDLFILNVLI